MVERSKNTDLEGAACATEKNLKEIIHVKYAGEQPTVSARELHEFLEECVSFEEFFIKVCELKVLLNRDGLSTLYAIVKKFYGRYANESIIYLLDCIMCEKVLPLKLCGERNQTERNYQKRIIQSFGSIFPDFEYIGKEVSVSAIGRIDILATEKETFRPVIIELKVDGKNPTQQLISYATRYSNPILIGISDCKIPVKNRDDRVKYYTYKELGLYE